MPLTAEQAANLVAEEIKKQGGSWKPGNILDAIIGVAKSNSQELQDMLTNLFKKKGVLTATDEQAVNKLLAKQQEERRQRNRIRTKNTLLIIGTAGAVAAIIYFSVKKK